MSASLADVGAYDDADLARYPGFMPWQYLTRREAATMLDIPVPKLNRLILRGQGPTVARLTGAARYLVQRDLLIAWMDNRPVEEEG